MIRTIVSLESEDKVWLENLAKSKHISMSAIIRAAIRNYRKYQKTEKSKELKSLLERTAHSWDKGDALDYTEKLRKEW